MCIMWNWYTWKSNYLYTTVIHELKKKLVHNTHREKKKEDIYILYTPYILCLYKIRIAGCNWWFFQTIPWYMYVYTCIYALYMYAMCDGTISRECDKILII